MPSNPTPGFEYFQEFAEDDEAVDQARVSAFVPRVETPVGSFTNVLQILETNPLEPEDFSFKYYASGVGLIAEEEGLLADLPEIREDVQPRGNPENQCGEHEIHREDVHAPAVTSSLKSSSDP